MAKIRVIVRNATNRLNECEYVVEDDAATARGEASYTQRHAHKVGYKAELTVRDENSGEVISGWIGN